MLPSVQLHYLIEIDGNNKSIALNTNEYKMSKPYGL